MRLHDLHGKNEFTPAHHPFRVALYSHDTCGLGHMRRNLLIAETLVATFPDVNVLLITGAREVSAFNFPDRVDAVSLPSLHKESNEKYAARSFQLDISELIRIRASIIKTSIEAFKPDIFIVDKVPRGTLGELDETLKFLAAHTNCKCVLGLRDILDRPDTTQKEWKAGKSNRAVDQYFEEVWVYGDQRIYDQVEKYGFSKTIGQRIKYTGYLDPTTRLYWSHLDKEASHLLEQLGERFYICTVGGGQDGAALAHAFAEASFPANTIGLIVTGPHMPDQAKKALQLNTAHKSNIKLVNFLPEPIYFYQAAEKIVAMGGYNTTTELLGLSADALVVPRVEPRQEQQIRSEALDKLGLLSHAHPDKLSPGLISKWLQKPGNKANIRGHINMQGLIKIPKLLKRLLDEQRPEKKKLLI